MGSGLTPAPSRWRAVGASVAGTAHLERGGGCDDAHSVVDAPWGLVVVVADGAGSAPRGGDGARTVARTAAELMASTPAPASADALLGAIWWSMAAARAAIGPEPREQATTILVAAACGPVVAAACVGDGAVVVRSPGGGYDLLPPSDRGEYLNETTFLTSTAWEGSVRVGTGAADGFAVLSDGLELLAVDLAAGVPHPGFFDPLLAFAAGDDADAGALEEFLASPRVCARTDDDKTLVLAVSG